MPTSILFAPLQGYTEAPFRNAHARYFGGIDLYYTPFVRLEKGCFRNKDIRDIDPANNQLSHLVPQLIAHDPAKGEAILSLFIEKGYREVDINLGCPFPLLAKRHNGSGILPYPEEVAALLDIVRKHPDIRFSVKMRLGWQQPDECLALLPLLNELPLTHITMHPRLGYQQYKGETNLEAFAVFYESCRHPLVYNGDIRTVEDIHRICTRFPRLSGVMIGRGLLANPALALEYKEGRTLSSREMAERLQAFHTELLRHYTTLLEGGEGQVLHKMKTFWEYLLPEEDRKLKKAIHKSTQPNRYRQAVLAFFHHLATH